MHHLEDTMKTETFTTMHYFTFNRLVAEHVTGKPWEAGRAHADDVFDLQRNGHGPWGEAMHQDSYEQYSVADMEEDVEALIAEYESEFVGSVMAAKLYQAGVLPKGQDLLIWIWW